MFYEYDVCTFSIDTGSSGTPAATAGCVQPCTAVATPLLAVDIAGFTAE